MFVSVNGKAKKVVEIFAGGTDNKAHSIKELFGSVNGIAKLLYSGIPSATTGFDLFSWEEIKQLANEGKLLEHFNLYDKVTVKLKTPLESKLNLYTPEMGTKSISQKQTEMQFQIVELTETKMRLMSPRANVLGAQDFDIKCSYSYNYAMAEKWIQYAKDYGNDAQKARDNIADIWGLCGVYNSMRLIQDSLPDDLVNVLSVCARPIISWKSNTAGTSRIITYDENLRVRQLTSSVMSRGVKTDEETGTFYPLIHESYFPTTVSEYLYHISLPEEYDTYEGRKYIAQSGGFDGWKFLDYKEWNNAYLQSYCYAPEISCAYGKGMTSSEYSTWNSLSGIKKTPSKYLDIPTSTASHLFPEIIIEADA